MAQETVKAFFKQVEEDQGLSNQYKSLLEDMAQTETDEAAVAQQVAQFASRNGYEFAVEDLKSVAAEMQGGELTNEQLDAVAGGKLTWIIVTGGGTGMACFIVGYEKPS